MMEYIPADAMSGISYEDLNAKGAAVRPNNLILGYHPPLASLCPLLLLALDARP